MRWLVGGDLVVVVGEGGKIFEPHVLSGGGREKLWRAAAAARGRRRGRERARVFVAG
jgi:hypothetical protein